MGEPVIDIAAREAYQLWSSTYDETANPVLELEMRVLRPLLNSLAGQTVIDVATGTGRWAAYARTHGAIVIGFDLSPAMLRVASAKPLLSGRLAVADMCNIPLPDGFADAAICSFALSYVESPCAAIAEMARVARRIIVTDLHPMAVAAGWSRTFRSDGRVYRIATRAHSLAATEKAFRSAGFEKRWEVEARFGAPEQPFFRAAGREELFIPAQRIPAIFAECWTKA
jgi:ubiquinone/menaquinone biosynthesis C-methylase UbiE